MQELTHSANELQNSRAVHRALPGVKDEVRSIQQQRAECCRQAAWRLLIAPELVQQHTAADTTQRQPGLLPEFGVLSQITPVSVAAAALLE